MYKQDIFIIGLIVGGIVFYRIHKLFKASSFKRRMRKGKRAEQAAVKLLNQEGYKIVKTQETVTITTYIDGQPYKNHIRADFIVRKGLKKYVAEVKTGTTAPQASNAATRRQLLEYYLVYKPTGVILVDMEKKKIRTIEFTIGTGRINNKLIIILSLLLVGAVAIVTYIYLVSTIQRRL